MAECPNCGAEYQPPQDKCLNCGALLQGEGEAVNQGKSSGGKSIKVGDTYIYGQQEDPKCVICGKPAPMRYSCSRCHQSPLCRNCFDVSKGMCKICVEELSPDNKAQITCGICRRKVPAGDTFQCSKCLRVVCKDHLDPKTGFCQECAQKYEKMVAGLEKSDNVIGPEGKVIDPDDEETLTAHRGRITNSQGENVARIKDTTWYARQWYRTTPKRFQHEQRIMKKYYPQMQLFNDSEGNMGWQGKLTTWRENTYEVMIVYPPTFPYKPPKAYPVNPKIKQSRHIYEDGHLCLFTADDRIWEIKTTASTLVSWVAKWLHCYEVWLDTGQWPGKEADVVVIMTKY